MKNFKYLNAVEFFLSKPNQFCCQNHRLKTPNKGMGQKNLKFCARPCSEGNFLTGRLYSVFKPRLTTYKPNLL